jgi:hypothetical protein
MPPGSCPQAAGGGWSQRARPATLPPVKLVRRLVSPVGFLLALLFLLLPFTAASCDAPGLGSLEGSYTGVDLVTGGDPTITTDGELTRENGAPIPTPQEAPRPEVQILAIVTVAVLVAGIGVSLTPVVRIRTLGAIGAAAAGAALLISTEAAAQSHLKPAVSDGLQRVLANRPGEAFPSFNLTGQNLDELVHTEIGFWLSLIAAILVLLVNAGFLVSSWIGLEHGRPHHARLHEGRGQRDERAR